MRISDWSSDVCSSDLSRHQTFAKRGDHAAGDKNEPRHGRKDLLNGRGTAQAVESHPAENISAGRFCRRPKPPVISWRAVPAPEPRSEEHTSELQSLMRISYAVFCLKKKKKKATTAVTTD